MSKKKTLVKLDKLPDMIASLEKSKTIANVVSHPAEPKVNVIPIPHEQ